jgi:hypothetical protein
VTHLAQTHFRKMESTRNHPHQNVAVTRTQVKTLHKQRTSFIQSNTETNLDLRNASLGYGFHFPHRHSRMFPIESLAHDSGRASARAEYDYPKGSPNTNSSRRNPPLQLASATPNGLVVNLLDQLDNRQLRRHLPNDLPTGFLMQLSYL